jgi:hypothetical protein
MEEESEFNSDALIGAPVDDLFSYQTVKVVRIQDRWLGLWDISCKLVVMLIVGYMIIHDYGYLEWEAVTGTVSTRILGGVKTVNTSKMDYCKNKTCRLIDRFTIATYDDTSIFIDTHIEEIEQKRQCQAHDPTCPFESAFEDMQRTAYYSAGVEDMLLEIRHDAQAATFFSRCTHTPAAPPPAPR